MLSTKYVTNDIYLVYMYKQDLSLNNLQWLMCRETKLNENLPLTPWQTGGSVEA